MEKQKLTDGAVTTQPDEFLSYRVAMSAMNFINGRLARLLLLMAAHSPIKNDDDLGDFAAYMIADKGLSKTIDVLQGINETPDYIKEYAEKNPRLVKRWWLTRKERNFMEALVSNIISPPTQIIRPNGERFEVK